MKKLFTIDDFAVAYISAMGYGFGYTVPMHLGWPELACLVACFALGIALEEIIGKIVFCKTVQEKTVNRVFTYVAILLIFLIAELASRRLLGASLMEDLEEEFAWVVGLPILGFVVNLCIRGYHVRKIRKLYGDGGEGYCAIIYSLQGMTCAGRGDWPDVLRASRLFFLKAMKNRIIQKAMSISYIPRLKKM